MGADLYQEREMYAKPVANAYGACILKIEELLKQIKNRELTHEEKLILAMIKVTRDELPPSWG